MPTPTFFGQNQPVLGGPIIGGPGTPFILTVIPSATIRSDFNGCLGFKFNTPVGVTPTITHLGRWKLSGNSQIHSVKLYNALGVLRSVNVDLSTGSVGAFVYEAITQITLAAGTAHWVLSEEVSGGDTWYDGDTTLTVDTSAGTSDGAATQPGCSGTINGFFAGAHSYVPTDFKFFI